MIEWHFFDKVYRAWVTLVIGNFDEFKDFMEACGYDEVSELRDAEGYCVKLDSTNNSNGSNCCVIWLREFKTATLLHELAHLVMMIFQDHDVPIRLENTEAFAYYEEYWFTEIQRTRRRFPKGCTPAQARK